MSIGVPDFLTNGVFVAIIANGLIGISLVWDKVLIEHTENKSVANYVFWLGAMSIFGLILIFFGFHLPSIKIIAIALVAGFVHLIANLFYYAALKRGEASQSLAIMGGFSPTATALIAWALLDKPLGGESLIGFAVIVSGGFFMFLSEKIRWQKILPLVLLAAGTFGVTNVMQKIAFNAVNFVSAYVFFTIGTFLGSMFLLVRKKWRKQIFEASEESTPRSRFWYFVNRFISGVGSFLIFFAISKGNPAVVDAISGVRYAIIFLLTLALTKWKPEWLREEFRGWTLWSKAIATSMVVAGLVIIGLGDHSGASGGGATLHEQPQYTILRQREEPYPARYDDCA